METIRYAKDYRNLVSGLETTVPLHNGRLVTGINFDNAATTPPFKSVLKDIMNFAPWYSSIHRGTGYKSRVSSKIYEDSRKTVLEFVGGDQNKDTVIYVKNTTEAINKLSYRLYDMDRRNIILSTAMEHHSNDLPWRNKYNIDYVKVDQFGRLDIDDLQKKLEKYRNKVKLVTVTGASNVTGYVNSIHKIASIAHRYGAKILVDGAQLVPHVPVDMKPFGSEEHIDYLVFSSHKMYAPFGTGVLIGPRAAFFSGEPEYSGGGTVKIVSHEDVMWDVPPYKEEAGTPNIMGVVALISAINTLKAIGMKNIKEHEDNLLKYALCRLEAFPEIRLYSDYDNENGKVAIIPFNINGVHHSIVARILSGEGGIGVRSGCFCAQPYIQKLLNISKNQMREYFLNPSTYSPGMVRLSFGLYNTYSEIDRLINSLGNILKDRDKYIKRYK